MSVYLSIRLTICLWKSGFCMTTPFPFDLPYFTHVLTMTWGWPLLILGSKGQGQIWTSNIFSTSYTFLKITLFLSCLHWWYFTHVLTMTRGWPLLILRSKDQRSRSNKDLKFLPFLQDNCFFFWPTKTSHVMIIIQGGHLLILGSKGQSWIRLKTLHRFCTITLLSFDIQYSV